MIKRQNGACNVTRFIFSMSPGIKKYRVPRMGVIWPIGSFRVKSPPPPHKKSEFKPHPLQLCSNLVCRVILAGKAKLSKMSTVGHTVFVL